MSSETLLGKLGGAIPHDNAAIGRNAQSLAGKIRGKIRWKIAEGQETGVDRSTREISKYNHRQP